MRRMFDDIIFAFFALEMSIKMVAMGIYGKKTYLADSWNRLDCFIVLAGLLEYIMHVENLNLTAIRTIRVLRPLRAINRIPSMRILVMLLLDTLPMLGNVLLLCFFVFFIFGIVGVQLWEGILRQRCAINLPPTVFRPNVPLYYEFSKEQDYICSKPDDSGMHLCGNFPASKIGSMICNASAVPYSYNFPNNSSCVNWNQYYTNCTQLGKNPFQGTISFDNIGLAWVAIFLVISLEGWTDIMYYVQDAHSFWDWIYFVLLIVIGSFFMINLCLVVIATQFSETKKREMERMRQERARYTSTSTLASSLNNSEPATCYAEIVKYIAHLWRRFRRRLIKNYKKQLKKDAFAKKEVLTFSPSRIRSHHAQCPNFKSEANANKNKKISTIKEYDASLGSNSENHKEITVNGNEGNKMLEVPITVKSIERESNQQNSNFLSPSISRRRSNVIFNDYILLHSKSDAENSTSTEKMTQVGDGSIWQVKLSQNIQQHSGVGTDYSELDLHDALTCQELLAFSVAFSAALPTGRGTLESFYKSLSNCQLTTKKSSKNNKNELKSTTALQNTDINENTDDYSCCKELFHNNNNFTKKDTEKKKWLKYILVIYQRCSQLFSFIRRYIKLVVESKWFQQGILLAILINTLSMGIEFHEQPEELTAIVETSNIVFSAIFAIEMFLKVIAEGPFRYISNGFNVFDGVIVILSVIEINQQSGGGNSGLSVLRTFRLLRILKLVRFMPNLRRQLFVMLRTMDNVAVFFSLLVLFIFIFSILGMNLFGCKFCEKNDGGEMICDRKNFDSLLWAIVTVFQILTQEDWNVVLFNGMEKTSHWAALYFVALMTFGNYVLFNLLVAILVEGFSSERNERREREQRELVKKLREETFAENFSDALYDESRSTPESSSTNGSFSEHKNALNNIESIKKVDTIKDRKWEPSPCAASLRNPPLIMTTAATPQDSPNTFLTNSPVFRNWEESQSGIFSGKQLTINKSSNSFLKPPMLTETQHDNIPAIEFIPPSPVLENKFEMNKLDQLNINKFESTVNPTNTKNDLLPNESNKPTLKSNSDIIFQKPSRKSSFNKSSLEDKAILNNDKHLLIPSSKDAISRRIQNNFHSDVPNKRINKSRRMSSVSSRSELRYNINRNLSCYYQTLNNNNPHLRVNSNARRMSAIEVALIKSSNFNINNIEGRKSICYSRPKIDFEKWHKSLQSLNEPPKKTVKKINKQCTVQSTINTKEGTNKSEGKTGNRDSVALLKNLFQKIHTKEFTQERETFSLYLFSECNKFRRICTWFVNQKWFDNLILLFIALNCITLAMERPNIPPDSAERVFLASANYVFTVVFTIEMFVKVVATGMFYGNDAYFTSGWNIMDGSLVSISIIDLLMSVISESSPRIFGILRVFRLLRSLRPLRVINRAPGLKLVVQTLLSSLRPIGNIVLICCTFFIIFGILGVQLFKGTFYYCEGENLKGIRNKTECLSVKGNVWINRKYNFDDLGKALMSLFVLSSRDGWVNIMYTGLDAVGVDQQPITNFNEWRLLYFIAFILLVGFFVLNMFVGVVVENFHRCREEQEKEEKIRRAAKRALQMEKKRRKMHEPPYYTNYSPTRMLVHNVCTSKYFDLAIAAVIGLNVVTMALEYYMMPVALEYALKIFNYFFTAVFILEAVMKFVALGMHLYLKDKWNQLDVGIVILSIVGIVLEELETNIIPINPTIIRVMRVLRIARVLKLLKMAKGIRALLDTVMQALPQVGNLGLLFFLLFFIFAALGVELFGRLECSDLIPCQGLGEHAHFANFGMAFLTLFRVATGDNWNGIMKDTLRDNCDDAADCVRNCCVSSIIAPIFFVIFVLMAQFVLVNVVVAVLMKHLEESHKQMEDEMDMDYELEREFVREQEYEEEQALCNKLTSENVNYLKKKPLEKVSSLPSNFASNSWSSNAIIEDDIDAPEFWGENDEFQEHNINILKQKKNKVNSDDHNSQLIPTNILGSSIEHLTQFRNKSDDIKSNCLNEQKLGNKKSLIKSNTEDDDHDATDESSLLLPPAQSKLAMRDGLYNKNDEKQSSDLIRAIYERRQMDKKGVDNKVDYNNILSVQ
ncbi:CACNA1G family protein [Megaselia abdita]